MKEKTSGKAKIRVIRGGTPPVTPCSRNGQRPKGVARRAVEIAVSVRRQTTEEQQRFETALELLLTEMVRQEITKRKERQE